MNRLEVSPSASSALPAVVLPPRRDSAWVVETRPAATAAWLAALPLADSAQTAQQLYQALFTLNRMELDANDRLQVMELYREPVAAAAAGLQAHLAHFALPLRPRLKQLADFLCQWHMEMAYGYKHALEAARDEHRPWENDALLLALARSIHYLGEVLLHSYQVYMPTPPGVWREIHALYRYAEQHGRQRTSLAALNAGAELTVERAYLQVLMLGLCGPYQLPLNECYRVNALLARWAHKAEIGARVEGIDPVGHFLLDLEADHPAVPFPRDVPLHARPALRTVNAIELARTVHGFIARLRQGEPPRALDLGFECLGAACTDTLKRMLRFWGLAGRRQFSRRPLKQPLSLCTGLNAIHFFASGQRPFSPPRTAPAVVAEQAAQAPSRADLEAEAHEERPVTAPLPEVLRVDSRWQVRDESAGGLALARRGGLGPLMRVGDVLGIHNPALDQWRVGVVRWLKSADSQHVEMGVEMLAPSVRPLAVRPAGAETAPYSQALLLPPIEALRQPATLLVALGICRPGEDIEIADGDQPVQRVRVLNVAERTSAFAQVVFADVARH
jgi:hypothetical protein